MMYLPQDGYSIDLILFVASDICSHSQYNTPEFALGFSLLTQCMDIAIVSKD